MRTPAPANVQQKRWPSALPLLIVMVVVAEIAFLGRIDLAGKAAMVEQWTNSFYFTVDADDYEFPSTISSASSSIRLGDVDGVDEEFDRCVERLERLDSVRYSRDFAKDPILVNGPYEDRSSCSVSCKFGYEGGRSFDAAFGFPQDSAVASVHRSMESSHYYPENNVDTARGKGYKIVMTTSLSSDVPVGYFSWAEYDIMAPVGPKTEDALAAAFISNCGARNFRLQALEMLEQLAVKIDSYGYCHRNRDGNVNKVEALKHYKFSLAFENSNEEDYVTEKFFQSLIAGAIPVVIGAPNIQEFAPSADSILHIKEPSDVATVAKTMKYLATNQAAYNKSLEWKYKGPSDSFKALVDMAAVHSSCRLCLHLATKIHEEEEKALNFKNRPCSCNSKKGTVYHVFVRERGRFQFESIYLRSDSLTLKALDSAVLAKFRSLNHIPIWKNERPPSIRGGDELKVYRVYPVGLTQRQALYTFRFNNDAELERHIKNKRCAKLEVIFV